MSSPSNGQLKNRAVCVAPFLKLDPRVNGRYLEEIANNWETFQTGVREKSDRTGKWTIPYLVALEWHLPFDLFCRRDMLQSQPRAQMPRTRKTTCCNNLL